MPLVSPAPLSQQGAETEHPRAAGGLGPARRHLPDISRDSASSSLTPGGKVAFEGDPQESQAGPLPRSTDGCLAFGVTIRLVPQSLLLQCGLAFPDVDRSHRSTQRGERSEMGWPHASSGHLGTLPRFSGRPDDLQVISFARCNSASDRSSLATVYMGACLDLLERGCSQGPSLHLHRPRGARKAMLQVSGGTVFFPGLQGVDAHVHGSHSPAQNVDSLKSGLRDKGSGTGSLFGFVSILCTHPSLSWCP